MKHIIRLALLLVLSLVPMIDCSAEGEATLTLSFLGDCSIGETYQHKGYESSYTATVDKNGCEWPFSLVREALDADDLTIANLEVVLTERRKQAEKRLNLVAEPRYVEVLLQSGAEVFNTVNNHAMDFLAEGYQDTLDTLDSAGIAHFGSIHLGSAKEVNTLLVREVKGVRIGFAGYTYPELNKALQLVEGIEMLQSKGCQLIIVSLHWGREEHTTPEGSQINLAKTLIDAGADVIYGHHPHILQPIQFYRDKPVFFSTGNFTFGTMSVVDPDTGIFQLQYEIGEGGPVLTELTVLPARTQGTGDFRPYLLEDEAEQRAVWKKLTMKKPANGMENPPPGFLETGKVTFENGVMRLP